MSMTLRLTVMVLACALAGAVPAAEQPAGERPLNQPPKGFTAVFNGKDLAGWWGLGTTSYTKYRDLAPDAFEQTKERSREDIHKHWSVENGELVNDGRGLFLTTDRFYGDFELLIDYRTVAKADSGIYLRGTPQVQVWDPVAGIDQAKVGSGGLYNNQKNPSKPLVVADNPAGQWNTFYIRMIGELVTVRLNDKLVVDNVPLENYWDRTRPIYPTGQIELQTHGGEIRFRNIFLREIPPDEANQALQALGGDGFAPIFNGKDLEGWQGATDGYLVENGTLICDPKKGGNLLTKQEYADFAIRFEFRLPPGGNNGLAIRARHGKPRPRGHGGPDPRRHRR